jgi:hypothetical protein
VSVRQPFESRRVFNQVSPHEETNLERRAIVDIFELGKRQKQSRERILRHNYLNDVNA